MHIFYFRFILILNILMSFTLNAAVFKKGPYLLYENNNTQMVVLWQTDDVATISEISWGLSPNYENGPFTVPVYGDNQYKYIIESPTPGALCYYKVNVDGIYETGTFRFAPPSSTTSVSLYEISDTQLQPDIQNEVLAKLLNDMNQDPSHRQTILLHAGDRVMNGDDELSWENEFFNRSYPYFLLTHSSLPIMGTRGNHEGTATLLRKYWPYPYQHENDCYFSFDYGPVHVTVVDANVSRNPGDEQYIWIENDVKYSPKPWKIAIFHQPAYSAGPHPNDYENQILTENIFEKYGVSLIINGHNHYFGHFYKPPVHHITTGGGGGSLYDFDPDAPYLIFATKNHHFNRIDIDGNQLCVTSIGINGETLYNFCIIHEHPGKINNSLTLSKRNNSILLNWSSTSGTCYSTAYNIYRGSLPFTTYNHDYLACNLNDTSFMDTPPDESYYYLIVPQNENYEGSYGTDSSGNQRPQSTNPCLPQDYYQCW